MGSLQKCVDFRRFEEPHSNCIAYNQRMPFGQRGIRSTQILDNSAITANFNDTYDFVDMLENKLTEAQQKIRYLEERHEKMKTITRQQKKLINILWEKLEETSLRSNKWKWLSCMFKRKEVQSTEPTLKLPRTYESFQIEYKKSSMFESATSVEGLAEISTASSTSLTLRSVQTISKTQSFDTFEIETVRDYLSTY